MFPPALSPPLDTGHQREQDGRQTSSTVVVDEMSSVESDQSSGEHDHPAEEVDVGVVLVWKPLGHQTPGDPEGQTYYDLDRSVESKLHRVGVLVESNSQKYSESTDGHHVVSSAGGDDESGNSLGNTVTSEK